jgi:predicted nucleic acid-binding protein
MNVFFDSSAFAKRYIEESGSEEIERLCLQASEIGLSVICFPEILSALNMRLRERNINSVEYYKAKERLVEELTDIQIINLTSKIIAKTGMLLENYVLKTMDALHIACAIEWEAELFVTADHRQAKVAKHEKLVTKLS